VESLIYAGGVIVFFLGVVASIALHEVGHMVPAKKFGVKVTQYFVGFGKTVWSVRRGETEYGIKLIPLGGFVKLVGMLPPAKGQDPAQVRASNTGMFTQLIADARHAEYEHVQPGEEDRLFYRKPWWQKLIVMASGPLVNVAIAFVLFTVVISGFGVPQATTTVEAVSECVIPASEGGRTAPRRPGGSGARAARPGTRSCRSTARRSPMGAADRPDPRQPTVRPPSSSSAAAPPLRPTPVVQPRDLTDRTLRDVGFLALPDQSGRARGLARRLSMWATPGHRRRDPAPSGSAWSRWPRPRSVASASRTARSASWAPAGWPASSSPTTRSPGASGSPA
jgi:hypothetical protein